MTKKIVIAASISNRLCLCIEVSLLRRLQPVFNDFAIVEHDDPVGIRGDRGVMGDDE
ncbi:MAG: hypothetical protein HND48_16655 [Chloroflexi bacterium]|nr:hypothetical protein [Chloroflexota bacterium]